MTPITPERLRERRRQRETDALRRRLAGQVNVTTEWVMVDHNDRPDWSLWAGSAIAIAIVLVAYFAGRATAG